MRFIRKTHQHSETWKKHFLRFFTFLFVATQLLPVALAGDEQQISETVHGKVPVSSWQDVQAKLAEKEPGIPELREITQDRAISKVSERDKVFQTDINGNVIPARIQATESDLARNPRLQDQWETNGNASHHVNDQGHLVANFNGQGKGLLKFVSQEAIEDASRMVIRVHANRTGSVQLITTNKNGVVFQENIEVVSGWQDVIVEIEGEQDLNAVIILSSKKNESELILTLEKMDVKQEVEGDFVRDTSIASDWQMNEFAKADVNANGELVTEFGEGAGVLTYSMADSNELFDVQDGDALHLVFEARSTGSFQLLLSHEDDVSIEETIEISEMGLQEVFIDLGAFQKFNQISLSTAQDTPSLSLVFHSIHFRPPSTTAERFLRGLKKKGIVRQLKTRTGSAYAGIYQSYRRGVAAAIQKFESNNDRKALLVAIQKLNSQLVQDIQMKARELAEVAEKEEKQAQAAPKLETLRRVLKSLEDHFEKLEGDSERVEQAVISALSSVRLEAIVESQPVIPATKLKAHLRA